MEPLPSAVDRHQKEWNKHNADKVAETYAEASTYQDPFLPQPLKGRAAVQQYLRGLFATFPDFEVRFLKTIVSGNMVVQINTAGGTMKGPSRTPEGRTIPATNKRFSGEYAVVFELGKDSKILSLKIYGDSLAASAFKQLGLPSP